MKETTERYFDNGGQTIDRYTIIIGSGVYGMSENPTHAQGFNQYCGEVEEFDLSDNEGAGQAIEVGRAARSRSEGHPGASGCRYSHKRRRPDGNSWRLGGCLPGGIHTRR